MRSLLLLFAVGLLAATARTVGSAPLIQDSELRDRLQPLAERVMSRELTPGLQVAVVTRDGRLWSGAFGTADLETGRPVAESTRFYIASTSKAIMGLTGALLDDRGIIDLDATLAEVFPEQARFHRDYDPSSATVRDLLTHTHGISPGPIGFRVSYTGQYTNDLLFRLLALGAPMEDRSFHYSNLGYNLYGLLMAPDETFGWKKIQAEVVLEPLGMTRTTNYPSRLDESEMAMPHDIRAGGMTRIRLGKNDATVGPAGGHFSTAGDLARLVLMELNLGRLGDERIFPERVIAETQRQQVPQDREIFYYHRHGWGIGWDIGTYDGDTVIHRPGAFAGYYSNVAFLPDHGFGIVVLSNGGPSTGYVAEALTGAVYDVLRGRDGVVERMDDRLDHAASVLDREREKAVQATEGVEILDEPLRPLDAYVGTYDNELIGTMEIVRTDRGLQARMGALQSDLEPQPRLEDPPAEPFFAQLLDSNDQIRFHIGEDGTAESLTIRGVPGGPFRRPR